MLQSLMAAATFCVVASLAQATVYFRNTGTVSGWDGSNLDPNCSLTDSTSVVYKGSTSFKAQTNYNSSYAGRYHAMKTKNNVYRIGSTGFYGFAFYLQSTWDFQPQQYQLFQFIGNFTGSGCDTWMPTMMVWIYNNQLNTRRKYGSVCAQQIQTYSNLATVSAGVWHRIIIQALWKTDNTGYVKLWFNGSKVLEHMNVATTISDSANRYYRMDVGIYANSWYDQKRCLGSTTRMAWFDNISWASTYAEADPAQW